jgi:hypothetical protein
LIDPSRLLNSVGGVSFSSPSEKRSGTKATQARMARMAMRVGKRGIG